MQAGLDASAQRNLDDIANGGFGENIEFSIAPETRAALSDARRINSVNAEKAATNALGQDSVQIQSRSGLTSNITAANANPYVFGGDVTQGSDVLGSLLSGQGLPITKDFVLPTQTGAISAARGISSTTEQVKSNAEKLHDYALQLSKDVEGGRLTSLEAGARLTEFAAVPYKGSNNLLGVIKQDDVGGFLRDLATVGANRNYDTFAFDADTAGLYVQLGTDSGFAPNLQDNSAQVRHFIGGVLASYRFGVYGTLRLDAREYRTTPIGIEDIRLNHLSYTAGAELGTKIKIDELGEYMRRNLSP